MKKFLFNEFDPVSAKQWKQKIQMDLKGADYQKTLLTQTNEGITIKPFYHKDEVKKLLIKETNDPVKICQDFFVSDEKKVNFLAKDALQRGADAVLFEANEPFDIATLLKSISGNVHFKLNFNNADFLRDLINYTSNRTVFVEFDPIGNLAKTGNWFNNQNADFTVGKSMLHWASSTQHVLAIHADLYQNAGANGVQQIAYALSHLNEYLHLYGAELNKKIIEFKVAIGANYFMEIAKLRALRYLFDLVVKEYDLAVTMHLFATPSLRNKTLYDYNVNMLRTTSECMSAMLGGCHTLCNLSYDALYHKKNEFGERIARNQPLILKEESFFKEAGKVAEGTYYIENLTTELAQKALDLLKDIERNGGFLKQLTDGTIQRKIKESAQKEQQQFDHGEKVLVGSNRHPNKKDRMHEELELYPFVKVNKRSTKIVPIIPRRLSESLEQERLAKEKE
ncbi:methylmalonyl-CoA mutase subunit beta [Flavobacteriaceae bacterium F08102]|nr:methylmalonyl-CoA mutase subunit beta [Flavobacteriaceae bacterium F08102]